MHFWALALMIKDDYAAVGVPMAPLVIGERATVLQMVMYALLTVVLTVIPFRTARVRRRLLFGCAGT